MLVARGPKENQFRSSIDALFRSAAYTYGPRVIDVVLTGYLDDGTSGLWSVQRMGGVAVVQEPRDAEQPSMPTNALEFVKSDYFVPLAELATLLVRLTAEPAPARPPLPAAQLDLLKVELAIAKQGGGFELGIIGKGKPTPFTCPDCHGALTQLIEGKLIRYRCHTGHTYTVSALLGCPLAEALPEAEAQGFLALLEGVYATGESYHGQEMPLVDEGPPGRAAFTSRSGSTPASRCSG